MRHAHINVVHHHAELVHRLPKFLVAFAGTQQDEILDFVVGKFALAEHRIGNLCRSADGNFEADGRLRAWRRRFPVAASAAREAPRPAALRLLIPARLVRLGVIPAGIFVGRAVAKEGLAVRNAFLCGCAIQFGALRLVERSFVPIHAQPFQAIDDALDQFGLVALGVRVLDAQDHHAAVAPRKQPVKKSRAGPSDVQIAGGRRCEADSHARGLVS